MGTEIERKFLVNKDRLPYCQDKIEITQAYLSSNANTTVRVRIANEQAYLTIKGKTIGISRAEYEYEIPLEDAKEMIQLSTEPYIVKTRYLANIGDKLWEIDIFDGENKGLIIAECELLSEDEELEIPDWITEEVSGDARYNNSQLASNPFSKW